MSHILQTFCSYFFLVQRPKLCGVMIVIRHNHNDHPTPINDRQLSDLYFMVPITFRFGSIRFDSLFGWRLCHVVRFRDRVQNETLLYSCSSYCRYPFFSLWKKKVPLSIFPLYPM